MNNTEIPNTSDVDAVLEYLEFQTHCLHMQVNEGRIRQLQRVIEDIRNDLADARGLREEVPHIRHDLARLLKLGPAAADELRGKINAVRAMADGLWSRTGE